MEIPTGKTKVQTRRKTCRKHLGCCPLRIHITQSKTTVAAGRKGEATLVRRVAGARRDISIIALTSHLPRCFIHVEVNGLVQKEIIGQESHGRIDLGTVLDILTFFGFQPNAEAILS